jgi:hypothetical protein
MILEFARGHILAEIDGKRIRIDGELLVHEEGLPDYVIYRDSIERWQPPHENEVLDETERERIIEILRTEMGKKSMTIEVE